MDINSIFTGGNVKPNTIEKNIIRQHLHNTDRIQQFHIRSDIDKEKFPVIKSTQEFEHYIQRENAFGKVFGNLDMVEDEWYYCDFVSGNDAWISKDEAGVYRYFSKTKLGGTISLNIFDVVEIVLGNADEAENAFQSARSLLANLFELELKDEWVLQQAQKYQSNLQYIRGERKDLEQAYPAVFQFIQKYYAILEYFNDHQEDKLYRVFSYENQHVFFSATNRIKEKLNISQSTVTRSINMLALSGLIVKIPHQKLPSRMLEISDAILSYRMNQGYIGGKRITFYTIPEYSNETLQLAEKVVIILQAAGVWGSLLTKEKVSKHFGEARANQVYLAEYTVKKINSADNSTLVDDAEDILIDIEDDPIPF
ncbi:hypothetical protein [Paenibacillus sp. DR312]|uniref:hypothetical protein n=1 Tax=unclassified Paenibacillus TaxID=185978 RepID=UPI001C944B5F|nr:hypothetical protein [Paenibacillus sp. DR312]QZN76186.1 hypothetical protein K5K90_02435 [Paenibacillus sp. DR312]